MSGLAVRNEARALLWERGLTVEHLPMVEWVAAVDAEVERLTAPGLADEALASLDAERQGRVALEQLFAHTMSGTAWQFLHNKVSTGEYMVAHEREGCGVCDLMDEIAKALWESRSLARRIIREQAA